jgi:Glycosyl hydrolase family 26
VQRKVSHLAKLSAAFGLACCQQRAPSPSGLSRDPAAGSTIVARSGEEPSSAIHAASQRDSDGMARVRTPPPGTLYHSVFPGSASDPGSEDAITNKDLDAYESAVGHRVAWVYFSHEWAHGEAFPLATATWIRARGSVPFVRIMMRSVAETGRTTVETNYTLSSIVAGKHDAALAAWGDAAHAFGTPLIAEWGTEMNGDWFPWNAAHNGKAAGAALFRAAYQHIVSTIRGRGARSVTWAFHVNGDDEPVTEWNRFEQYYPGDDSVDWLGISAYGAQSPDGACPDFVTSVDAAVSRLSVMAASKPIFVLEFGTTRTARQCEPTAEGWTSSALDALVGGRWPAVRGFAWWNERWENGGARRPTDMRVQNAPAIATAFRKALAKGVTIERPLLP